MTSRCRLAAPPRPWPPTFPEASLRSPAEQGPSASRGTRSSNGDTRARGRSGAVVALVPLTVVLALLMGVAASGCGADTAGPAVAAPPSIDGTIPQPDPASPGGTAPGTSADPSAAELQIRALIDHFWPVYLQSILAPDADHAALAAMLIGDASIRVLGRIDGLASNRQRVQMPEPSVFEHHILSVTFGEEDLATVRECVVDDLRVIDDDPFRDADGIDHLVVIDDDVVTVEYTTAIRRDDDQWRMTVREITESLEGIRDCAIFS